MRVIKALVLIQGIALLFSLFPFDGIGGTIIQPFPFHTIIQGNLYFKTFVWMICSEHINWIIMYGVVLSLISHKYKPAVFLFGCMEIIYFIEFLLNYNQTWFSLPLVGQIGMTHLFIIFKGMILFTLWIKNKQL